MKRFLTTLLISITIVGGLSAVAPAARAQVQCGPPTNIPCQDNSIVGPLNIEDTTVPVGTGTVLTPPPSSAGTQDLTKAGQMPLPDNPPDSEGYAKVMIWIMSLFAWLVGVAAITLDNAVYYTVVTMGNVVNNLTAVGVAWRILRDIGNILLIFGFLAIGISTILNTEMFGWKNSLLPMLLVGAIALNFSLFISEAVVDSGNLFATQFYTQINGGQPAGAKNFDLTSVSNEGISNKIMGQLGMQTIYGDVIRNKEILKGGNTWLIGFMGTILFMVAAFVMFSLAFILISRFVILIFVIIVSPIGFAGLAIPKLSGVAKQWWGYLFDQTITAPILLLGLYIALAIITDERFLTGFCVPSAGSSNTACTANAWTGFASGNYTGFASMLLSFVVAMGLLLMVTIIARKLSAFGSDWAMKSAGKLTFGATAWGMRSTVGWGSQRLSQSLQGGRLARLGRVPIVGRSIANVLDRGAKSNFDIRGRKVLKEFPFGGVDAGPEHKGGYREYEKKKIKEREDYAKTLKLTPTEKAQLEAKEKEKKDLEGEINKIEERNEEKMKDLRQQHKEALEPLTEKTATARRELEMAQATGNRVEIDKAQLNLSNTLLGAQQVRDDQNREREELKTQLGEIVKVKQTGIKVLENEIFDLDEDRVAQRQYADRLTWGSGKWFYRNVKARNNIRKYAKKGESDRNLDTIKNLLAGTSKKSSGGGEKKPEKKAGEEESE